jgi:hypothetical protein
MAFANVLGKVMSKIMLTILWIVGFGSYGIVMKAMRLFRKDTPVSSTWIDVPPTGAEDLRRQF